VGTLLSAAEAFEAYAQHAASARWEDLPLDVRRRAVRVLADDMAATCSAVDEPEIVASRAVSAETALLGSPGLWPGVPTASVLASGRPRAPLAEAAGLNGLAMGWNELDEGYRKAVCHAGLYVLPALLATAEARAFSVREVLRALVIGYDVAARVARTWRFARMDLHPHAVLAPVGAAAGVASLMRLPAPVWLRAVAGASTLGMAGPFTQATQGVLARNTWAAQGAISGLHAVRWARCGIGGAATSPGDVYAALGARCEPAELDVAATPGWAIVDGYHKMDACCQYTHSAIDAVGQLLAGSPALRGGERVREIVVQAHPLGFGLNNAQPDTTLGAKFSLPHAVAAAFVHGHGGVQAFDAAALQDPRITRLRPRVRLEPMPDVRPWPEDRPARVRVITDDGKTYEAVCWSARGGPDRPWDDAALWDKIQALSAGVLPGLVSSARALDASVTDDASPDLAQPFGDWLARCF